MCTRSCEDQAGQMGVEGFKKEPGESLCGEIGNACEASVGCSLLFNQLKFNWLKWPEIR